MKEEKIIHYISIKYYMATSKKKTFIFSFVTQFSNVHQMCVCVMCDEKKNENFLVDGI